jgi:hypothetical protein
MTQSIYSPLYLQIYHRKGTHWSFYPGKVFYNAHEVPTDLNLVLARNGLTKAKVLIELFRVNGGQNGYYIANIRDKQYYYCGSDWADVKVKLRQLGIGRDDPN